MNKVPVSKRALIQRINRVLSHDKRILKITRDSLKPVFGDYYIIDLETNDISETNINLEKFGRKIKALRKWEALFEEHKRWEHGEATKKGNKAVA